MFCLRLLGGRRKGNTAGTQKGVGDTVRFQCGATPSTCEPQDAKGSETPFSLLQVRRAGPSKLE